MPPPPACPPGQSAAIRLDFFLGRETADGRLVSDAEFADFLDRSVTPAFPDGLTLLAAQGQWRDEAGRLWHEPAAVVSVLLFDREALDDLVAGVSEAYRTRFQQQSVLVVETPACAAFR